MYCYDVSFFIPKNINFSFTLSGQYSVVGSMRFAIQFLSKYKSILSIHTYLHETYLVKKKIFDRPIVISLCVCVLFKYIIYS